jgi:hypothetical protein
MVSDREASFLFLLNLKYKIPSIMFEDSSVGLEASPEA